MTYVLLFFLSSWFYFISHVPKDISPRDRTVETDEPKINVYIYIYYTRTVQTVQYTVYVQGPRKFCDHRKVTCQSATDHPGSSTSPHLPIADLPQAEGQTPPPHEQIQTGKAMVNNGGCHNKQKGLSNMINCENMGIQVID